MAKGKEKGMKIELKTAIETLSKISGYDEVSGSAILRSAFEKLELKLRRDFMELDAPRSGKKVVESS